jgi:hypothetical protein
MFRRIFSQSIVALLLTGIAGVVTVSDSGCATPVEQPAPLAKNETLGKIDAQPQTLAETGIESWTVTRDGTGVRLDGKSGKGVIIHQVRLQPFSSTVTEDGRSRVVAGFEISTPGGGFVRAASDGRVLEFRGDTAAFAAFARDAQALHKGDVTLNCSAFAWIACAGSILAAVTTCGGPENLVCIAAILQAFGCLDCFCEQFGCDGGGGGGGGGSGGGGSCPRGRVDCGDGRSVCPPQVCP